MKKIMVLSVVLILFLWGCSTQAALETETSVPTAVTTVPETETTVAAETLPEEMEATVLADGCPLILSFLSRGDQVEIVNKQEDGFYFVKTQLGYGLIDEKRIRPASQEAYEAWEGYAAWGTRLYDHFYMTGEGTPLSMNQKVKVLEDLTDCLLVQTDEITGYMEPEKINRWPIQYGGGSNGGGSEGGSSFEDGGDIEMQQIPRLDFLSLVVQSGEVTGTAEVLADEVPLYLGFYNRMEEVRILKDKDPDHDLKGFQTVYLDGIWAYVPSQLLKLPETPAYEAWDGFAAWPGEAFDNYILTGKSVKTIPTNTRLQVLEEFENAYLVSWEDQFYFMSKAHVTSQPTVYSHGNSGGSSGDSGGGDSGWTPPVL